MNTTDLLHRCAAATTEAQEVLERVVAALARQVGRKGRIDDARLEPHQSAAFALAQAVAQGQAAQEMTRYGERGEVEALLALVYVGKTLGELRFQVSELARRIGDDGAGAVVWAGTEALADLVAACSADGLHAGLLEALESRRTWGADGLGADHRLLQESVRAFAEKRVAPQAESFHREDRLIPDDLIREAGELGCFGLSIPLAFGGFQERPDHVGMVVVTEALSHAALAFGSLATRPEILAKALLRGGTEAQQARFLPDMASGRKMVAIAVTEPDFGSDVASLAVTARPDGDGWRINGTKTWSTLAGRAELIGLLARTEPDPALGHRGLSMFVVEKPADYGQAFTHTAPGGGTLAGRAIPTAGYRGMHSFELTFEDYHVPGDNLVGGAAGRGRGFYLQMEAFSAGRLQTAGRAVGVMQAALEQAVAYSRARQVFGKALAAFPLTREKLARMAAVTQACRQQAFAAARLLDEGEGQVEASMVKFLACRQAEWVTREAQQLHGGMGYAEEFAVSRLFIDARVLSIFEGTEEVLALKVIVPSLLRPHLA